VKKHRRMGHGFRLTFFDFILRKANHVCLKENAVPICLDNELSWCRNVLVPNCLGTVVDISSTDILHLVFHTHWRSTH
jgi:hypothetical protein